MTKRGIVGGLVKNKGLARNRLKGLLVIDTETESETAKGSLF